MLTISLPFPYHFGFPAGKHFLQDELHCRKDYCKKAIADGRHIRVPYQIPIVGGGPALVGGVRGGHVWTVSVNMPQKWQVGSLIFPIQIPFANRIFADLHRPPVHLPPLLVAGPLWIPYSQPHFGSPAGKPFLQDKLNCQKDYCKDMC